ncbi:hypothetical protein [Pseudaestuariivita rosea]|uniref:hypothetical protein n=1 Tax=Pseudaestuariivita rosea TaxID=2763263 RepID=UPI001F2A8753|nr:hypothetical protein [Pseudaestuariivita rosea]
MTTTALAEAPLSAIDWLSDSLAAPPPELTSATIEPPVTDSATIENITVMPLNLPTPDGVGLLPGTVTGLPADLWGDSDAQTLSQLIVLTPTPRLPALQDLMQMVLLAEVNPPIGSGPEPQLLLARVDALLDIGAIEPAQALLERAGVENPDLFRRWFDLALLTGTEDIACETLRDQPGLTPSFPTRIFCLARNGDWSAAALTLETGIALEQINPSEAELLIQFLEPEAVDDVLSLAPQSRITPLEFRIREAIGEPLPTVRLPRAFAASDLRANAGWKAQLEAAERLAKAGAISENQLLGLYSARRASASGGVWERVQGIQALDRALENRDRSAIATALPQIWREMQSADLEVPFARLFASRLMNVRLLPETEALALRIALISPMYETAGNRLSTQSPEDRFLAALARGNLDGITAPTNTAAAIKDAFTDNMPPEKFRDMLQNGRIGEAILRGIALLDKGAGGDMAQVTQGLQILRAVGLEDAARQASLQLMLLERG